MKKLVIFTSIIFLIFMCSMKIHGAERYEDSMTVEFSDPSKPGIVKVFYGRGDITVTGYDGKNVIIKTKSKIKNLLNPPEDEKTKGLKRISGTSFHVASIEDENAVVVTRSLRDEIELLIQVPFKTSLLLGGGNFREKEIANIPVLIPIFEGNMKDIFEGNIDVKNVSGEMEISTVDGDIILLDISGEVIANNADGDIVITFDNVDREKPMYFSSVDGDIDVTFPSDIKANLALKTIEGEIYTDFDMDIVKKPEVEKKKSINDPSNILLFYGIGNSISAKINGGGPKIQMTTLEGNIYIRKGK